METRAHSTDRSAIEAAKSLFPIPFWWSEFGFPGEPKKTCCSPLREDKSPSFSFDPARDLWHDFGSGEGGDAIDFVAAASGLDRKEATKLLLRRAEGITPASEPLQRKPESKPVVEPVERRQLDLFNLETPTEHELFTLGKLRKINHHNLSTAAQQGFLWTADLKGHRSWILTDCARVNAQARRLDGEKWTHLPKSPKAYTLPGSRGAWPIGAQESVPFETVIVVEGAPDFIAAFEVIWRESRTKSVAPVAMLGAGSAIPADALPLFANKRVRIFPHSDEAGRRAAQRWAEQLASVGCEVDGFSFDELTKSDGAPVQDLNDLLQIDRPENLDGTILP